MLSEERAVSPLPLLASRAMRVFIDHLRLTNLLPSNTESTLQDCEGEVLNGFPLNFFIPFQDSQFFV